MTLFWIITAAMVVASVAMLAPGLLRRRQEDQLDRDQQNVVIARERLAELEAELAGGVLDQQQFDQAKLELEQALLFDLETVETAVTEADSSKPGRLAVGVLAVTVPALTAAFYLYLGSPQLIDGVNRPIAHAGSGQQGDKKLPSMEEMIDLLSKRLKENPSDASGWFLLGRTYMSRKEYPKAVESFEQLYKLVGDQPEAMLALADALAMSSGGNLRGRAGELIRKSIKLAPTNSTGLWLGGMLEEQEGNYAKAVKYWQLLLPLLQDEPGSLQEVNALIARAREKGGLPATGSSLATAEHEAVMPAAAPVAAPAEVSAASLAAISVRVSLAPELQSRVTPEESLFVYARPTQGPRMPLAAARLKVKDLPLEITLDDSSAMSPQMKLSNFEQVLVGARVSRSGNAITSSGDLKGEVAPVKVSGAGVVDIVIDTVVP